MPVTKTEDLLKKELLTPILSYELDKELQMLDFIHVDKSLTKEGEGDEITVSAYTYIGKAGEVAEGEPIPTKKLGHTKTKMTVKKVANGVELTDEAVKRDHGDPVKESISQLSQSILEEQLDKTFTTIYNTDNLQHKNLSTKEISYEGIIDAAVLLGKVRKNHARVLIIHNNQHAQLLKDPNFMDSSKYNGNVMITGEIGMIAGCRVVVDNGILLGTSETAQTITKVPDGKYGTILVDVNLNKKAPIQEHAITMLIEKEYSVETARNAKTQTSEIYASLIYGVYVSNLKKVVLATFKGTK